jgi:D-alanyl-D-alanine carboxypeptidase
MEKSWRRLGAGFLAVQLSLAMDAFPAAAQTKRLDALVRAYPDFLAGHDGSNLEWTDGSRMPVSDGNHAKSFHERLRSASIADQLRLAYPKGRRSKPPARRSDPGRFRNTAFFDKMYGDCAKGETQRNLVKIQWLPKLNGGDVAVTSVNGVAERLKDVSRELERMPKLRRFLLPSAGTFNCRTVKDTGQRSMHAWGAAIDINTRHADYWLLSARKRYRNRIPWRIVAVFERHGFIWGGKWSHFDTMHFEYRPELLRLRGAAMSRAALP